MFPAPLNSKICQIIWLLAFYMMLMVVIKSSLDYIIHIFILSSFYADCSRIDFVFFLDSKIRLEKKNLIEFSCSKWHARIAHGGWEFKEVNTLNVKYFIFFIFLYINKKKIRGDQNLIKWCSLLSGMNIWI